MQVPPLDMRRPRPGRTRIEVDDRRDIVELGERLGEVDDVGLVAGLAPADNVGVESHSYREGCW